MMKLSSISEIWRRPPKNASNAVKAAIYVERTKVVLNEVMSYGSSHPVVHGGRVCRRRFVERIGCGYATVSQNTTLRRLVEDADTCLAKTAVHPKMEALRVEVESLCTTTDEPVIERIRPDFSKLIRAGDELVLAEASFAGLPTIVLADGIFVPGSRWLRHLVLEHNVSPDTAFQYAKALRQFIMDCRRRNRRWQETCDAHLIAWRERLTRRATKRRANASLNVIFQFFVFCEQTGLLRYHVGCYDRQDLPVSLGQVKFPISAKPKRSSGGNSNVWTTTQLHKRVNSSVGTRATPTDDQIEGAHRQALKRSNGTRDTLLMRWAEDTGSRRAEVLQLKVAQIPCFADVDELAENPDGWYAIDVKRKGGDVASLRAQPDTLYATLAYMRIRRQLVEGFKAKWPDYKEPEELFISSTTGRPLRPDSVTKLVGRCFRTIGLKAANVHRIRAKFAMDAVETVLDAFLEQGIEFAPGSNWIETVLQQVAARMGHKNPSSLRHYLTAALDRRVRVASATADALREKSERNSRLVLQAALERARVSSRLIAQLDSATDRQQQAAALRRIADEVESQAEA